MSHLCVVVCIARVLAWGTWCTQLRYFEDNKWIITGGVAQAVKCLLCKCKALCSNPSPSKKERCMYRTKRLKCLVPPGEGQCGIVITPTLGKVRESSHSQKWER
jgi:hypothetical protein